MPLHIIYLLYNLELSHTIKYPQITSKQWVPIDAGRFAPFFKSYSDQCTELSTIFGSALHYPNNDSFTIWDAKQQEVRPACQIEPSTPSEVSQVLEILVHYWCYFSVKGGGHSRNPGDSNSVGGVTVDLDRMTQVDILEHGNRALVGWGATSYQVYEALDAHNLSFVGGRVGTVGVGGFTLGGGTSPFSNKYGWALDNVYEYEVRLSLESLEALFPYPECFILYRSRMTTDTNKGGPCKRNDRQRQRDSQSWSILRPQRRWE